MSDGTFVNDLLRGDPFATGRRQVRKVEETQRSEQAKVEAAMKKTKAEEEQRELSAAARARNRAVQRANRSSYSRGTILTSPIGVPGQGAGTGGKTLLGS